MINLRPWIPIHCAVLYPQNGDRVVTIDSATSLYSMYISWLSLGFQAIHYAIFFGLGDVLATYGSHMATPTDSDCIAKQVCVEPRPSALDMTLPAFAAERRRRVPAIDRYLLQAPALSSKPAARRCCSRSTGRKDGRTDGHPIVT